MTGKAEAPNAKPLAEEALTQAAGGASFHIGNNGGNNIGGDGGNEEFHGYGGDDYIDTHNGDDTAYGGSGNDVIMGYGGNDKMHGQTGNDYLNSHAGDDVMYGGEGNDTMLGSTGTNLAYGEEGDDVYGWSVGYSKDDVFHGGPGNNTVRIEHTNALQDYAGWKFDIIGDDKGTWVNGELVFKGPVSGTITIGEHKLTFYDVQRITDLPPHS